MNRRGNIGRVEVGCAPIFSQRVLVGPDKSNIES